MKQTKLVPLGDRFWAKVDKRGPEECWLWLGSMDGNGYGQINVAGRPLKAHRVVLMVQGHAIPPGAQVHHACGERACCNPHHLEITGSQAEHSAKHRSGCSKHGEAEIREVRSGKNVGMRYCRECNRLKAARRRDARRRYAGEDERLDALLTIDRKRTA